MPSRTQRILAVIAAVTGALPLGVAAVVLLFEGEPAVAAGCLAAALLVAAPLKIARIGRFRAACLVVGVPLLAGSISIIVFGGMLSLPASLALVAAGAIPREWPLWKGLLLAPTGILAAIFALLAGGYFTYSCLRPSPIMLVQTAASLRHLEADVDVERVVFVRSTADGYEWEFERGAADVRDATAARLRGRADVRAVRTRDERCD